MNPGPTRMCRTAPGPSWHNFAYFLRSFWIAAN